jgi:hypothetical protein
MNPGVLALVAVFALAVVCALWNVSHRRSIERRLAAQGFEPCDADAPQLEAAWRSVTGLNGSHELRLVRCLRRAQGGGMLHHFTVRERPEESTDTERANPGASYPAYMFDLPDPERVSRGPVTLHVLPSGSQVLRTMLAGTISLSASRPRLDVGSHLWSASIVTAHGGTGGRLDDLVPAAVQEKLARAAAHGFLILHIGSGKAAFAALPNHRDVDLQLGYLSEWL